MVVKEWGQVVDLLDPCRPFRATYESRCGGEERGVGSSLTRRVAVVTMRSGE